jgi:anaerobic dimethyl sulfoxide reductase subunit B (iron-sulfur subunit)
VSAESKKSRKCDYCKDFVEAGEKPACVAACPTRCLDYGDIEELRAAHGEVDQVEPLPSGDKTAPTICFNRSRLNTNGALPGETVNAPEELESKTLVA